jgi:hypothetical protein
MSTNKVLFLLISMVVWLLAGGALIYLAPAIAFQVTQSQTTATWLATLGRSGYYPTLALQVMVAMTIIGTLLSIAGQKYFPDRR